MESKRSAGGRVRPLAEDDAAAGVLPRLVEVVRAQPDLTAVADGVTALTYADLARQVAATRAVLTGTGADGPVALLHRQDAAAVGVLVGALTSGRPVVTLDPAMPVPRLQALAARAGAVVCLADEALLDAASRLGLPVVPAPRPHAPSARPGGPADAVEQLAAARPDPAAPAVLAFTSGTTGTPKLVVNDQRMLVLDAWGNGIGTGCYGAGDVVAHTLPLAFHAGLTAAVAAVLLGATVALYDLRTLGVAGFAPFVARTGARFAALSPGIARGLVATAPDRAQLVSLRAVSLSGEAVHGRDAERLRSLLPAGCVLHHRYGSSETGLVCDLAIAAGDPLPSGPLPVGHPVGSARIEVLDADGRPAPEGEPGVLAVTRRYLATGYAGDETATRAAFTLGPDGTVTYRSQDVARIRGGAVTVLGRRDHSVKVRGYLVEPGEVDAALFALPDVREAVTVGVPHPGGGYRLVAYVVPQGARPSAHAIRAALRATLPGHMVPGSVVLLDALPRTERGKLDRAALPPPPPAVTGTPARAGWETAVAEAWGWVLELEDVPRDVDFFELGGDSLAAEAVTRIVVEQLGVAGTDVSPSLLVEAPTVAQFAQRLERAPGPARVGLTVLRASGTRPPLWLVADAGDLGVGLLPLARELGDDLPCYALHSPGLERWALPDRSVTAAARRHLATLRAVQPHGPYTLAGHGFGGLVALELAQRLQAAGDAVTLVAVLDSLPLGGPAPAPSAADARGTGERARRLREQAVRAARRHRPGIWAGPALVVVPGEDRSAARAVWAPYLTGRWDVVAAGGSAASFLRDPFVRSTAARLREALDAVPPAGTGRPSRRGDVPTVPGPSPAPPVSGPTAVARRRSH